MSIKNKIKQVLFSRHWKNAMIEFDDSRIKNVCVWDSLGVVKDSLDVGEDYRIIYENTNNEVNDIYAHINIISVDENGLKKFTELYEMCQKVANNYIERNLTGKIINIVLTQNVMDTNAHLVRCLTEGLAKALGDHGISVNGMIVDYKYINDMSCGWIPYFLSKQSSVLCGQVITLADVELSSLNNDICTF